VAYPTATLPECQAVQQVLLLDEMDWVGTTEMLSQGTLPLLIHVVVEQRHEICKKVTPVLFFLLK
jgi:hypothetical protein